MYKQYISIIGVDPSTSHFGMVYGWYEINSQEFIPLHYTVLEPPDGLYDEFPPKGKGSERKSIVEFEQTCALASKIKDFFIRHKPQVVFAEVPVGAKGMKATGKLYAAMGLVCGSFTFPSSMQNWKIIGVTPQEVKSAATNGLDIYASKFQVMKWAFQNYPCVGWKHALKEFERFGKFDTYLVSREVEDFNEHMADALAAVKAGTNTRAFNAWLKAVKGTGELDRSSKELLKNVSEERLYSENKEKNDALKIDFGFSIEGYNQLLAKKTDWRAKGFKDVVPVEKCPKRKHAIMDAPIGWNDSKDEFISRLVKTGYSAEVIRSQIREYACGYGVMFSDQYLVSCFLLREIQEAREVEKKGKKSKKLKAVKSENHRFVDCMKLLGLFCSGPTLKEIEKTSNFDEKINKISNRIDSLSELVALGISQRMLRSKELQNQRLSAQNGEAPIDWRNEMYCADRLLEARISEIKKLKDLKRELFKEKREAEESKEAVKLS